MDLDYKKYFTSEILEKIKKFGLITLYDIKLSVLDVKHLFIF